MAVLSTGAVWLGDLGRHHDGGFLCGMRCARPGVVRSADGRSTDGFAQRRGAVRTSAQARAIWPDARPVIGSRPRMHERERGGQLLRGAYTERQREIVGVCVWVIGQMRHGSPKRGGRPSPRVSGIVVPGIGFGLENRCHRRFLMRRSRISRSSIRRTPTEKRRSHDTCASRGGKCVRAL